MATLGQYATVLHNIAGLRGKRFVYIPEPEEGNTFNFGIIKELTGSDTISCRPLYGDWIEFTPECKICTDCNYIPTREPDWGMKRRMKVIECRAKFMSNPDPTNPYEFVANYGISSKFPEWRKGLMSLLLAIHRRKMVASSISIYLADSIREQQNLHFVMRQLLCYDKDWYKKPVNNEPVHWDDQIYQVAESVKPQLLKLLLDSNDKEKPVWLPHRQLCRVTSILLEYGTDPKFILLKLMVDNNFNTGQNLLTFGPLYKLPYVQLHQIISLLLEYGMDPNSLDTNGNSPIDMVISELYPCNVDECINIMNLLVSHGASVYKKSHYIPDRCHEALEKHLSPYETADPDENELPAPVKKIQKVL
jgi:hypothetical protein